MRLHLLKDTSPNTILGLRPKAQDALQVMYNRAAQFWHALYNIFSQYKLIKGRKWMHFFGTQQRFFRQMLMAAKVSDIQSLHSCSAYGGYGKEMCRKPV